MQSRTSRPLLRAPRRVDHRSSQRPSRTSPFAGFVGSWASVVDFYALLLLLVACALGGGSSFADVPSLLYVRPIAMLCLLLFALTPAAIDWRTYRVPGLFLALFAALMLLQLVPLPPAMWTMLPGRAPYRDIAATAGLAQPWRPLSLTPDLTMNSLVALIVPAAVLVGIAKLRDDQRATLLPVLLVLCFVSVLVGIGQFAGGKDNPLYLYRLTYEGYPVGLLSNRNHQAALLSMLFPALRAWTLMPAGNAGWERNRRWLALILAVFTIPVVLGTGSRAGIGLMALGIVAALLFFPAPRGRSRAGTMLHSRTIVAALIAAMAIAIAATYALGRAASIDRLIALSAEDDQRFQFAPVVLSIIRRTFPAGTGLGSFDPVFREYEPDGILVNSYFNHAHNEVFELVMTAGLPGLLLLIGLLSWWGLRSASAWRGDAASDQDVRFARLGGCVVAFLLLASLVDYPLRTPLLSAVFAMGCAWLCARPHRADGRCGIVSEPRSG